MVILGQELVDKKIGTIIVPFFTTVIGIYADENIQEQKCNLISPTPIDVKSLQ